MYPTASTMPNNAFFRFAHLMRAARSMPGMPAIDPVEERMLNALSEYWRVDSAPSVLEAMQLNFGVSPTTVHRRLKTLHRKGLIELAAQADDSRCKRVLPTSLAMDYFGRLSECMAEALGATALQPA